MEEMKQTEGVPRGLLRFIVLKFLSEKPMSGVEIVQKITQQTKGKWKPSPGSLYPLLSTLQQEGFTVDSSRSESIIRQYALTNKGKIFFKQEVTFGQKFMEKMECLAPLFIECFEFGTCDQNLKNAKESAKRLLQTFIEIETKKHQLTKRNIVQITQILDDSKIKLSKIIQDIDTENKTNSINGT
jgi:DNA-binding PadR family transcriptional regulator